MTTTTTTKQTEPTREPRTHEVVIKSEHGFECVITCNRGERETIEDYPPYRVIIKNQLQECNRSVGGEVSYSLNNSTPSAIGSTFTFDKTSSTDDILQLWYNECFNDGTARTGELPKVPRVTLTLTKKGDD